MGHASVLTLEELDALDNAEVLAGYMDTRKGDPEPGPNRSRSYHHGWRMAMMDMREMEMPPEHRRLVHEYTERNRRNGR